MTTGLVQMVKETEGDQGTDGAVALELPTLTKATFLTYYRGALEGLADLMDHVHISDGAHTLFTIYLCTFCILSYTDWFSCAVLSLLGVNLLRDAISAEDIGSLVTAAIAGVNTMISNFAELIECSKSAAFSTRAVLLATVKSARTFLDAFLKNCMPLMEKHFVASREHVLAVLTTLQRSTRFLQRACSHSKDVFKDASLMAQVPALKRCLESVVFRTKVYVQGAAKVCQLIAEPC